MKYEMAEVKIVMMIYFAKEKKKILNLRLDTSGWKATTLSLFYFLL